MFTFALSISILISLFVATFLPFIMSGKRAIAAQEKAHRRRIADAKMNARLLGFNL